ncbi:hypothetical protein M1523_04735 [Patescibacteria group bacterium]|nr:hypothetical protein [Patescibacteria group bacterium]
MDTNPQQIFAWKAPLRAYKKRSRSILRFYIAVSLLLSLIVFFFGDKILIIPIVTVFFLFYVLTITPPPEVENKITTFGIDSAGVTIRWELLSHFYYTNKFGFDILTVVTHAPYFYHAFFVVPDQDLKQKITQILSQHLMYQEKPQRSFTDKAIDWFSNLLPDDKEENGQPTPSNYSALMQKLKQVSL